MVSEHFMATLVDSVNSTTNSTNTTSLYIGSCLRVDPDGLPYIVWMYDFMGMCVHSANEQASFYVAIISLICWIIGCVPQIITNFRKGHADGLSPVLLAQWMVGDGSSLIGTILSSQMTTQIVLAAYFVVIDVTLISQYVFYKSRDKYRAWKKMKEHDSHFEIHDSNDHIVGQLKNSSSIELSTIQNGQLSTTSSTINTESLIPVSSASAIATVGATSNPIGVASINPSIKFQGDDSSKGSNSSSKANFQEDDFQMVADSDQSVVKIVPSSEMTENTKPTSIEEDIGMTLKKISSRIITPLDSDKTNDTPQQENTSQNDTPQQENTSQPSSNNDQSSSTSTDSQQSNTSQSNNDQTKLQISTAILGALVLMCILNVFFTSFYSTSHKSIEHNNIRIGRKLLSIESALSADHNTVPFPPATTIGIIGFSIGWISTCCYIGSRVAQITKNYRAHSTEGLNPVLFGAAILGNLFYSLEIFLFSLDSNFLLSKLPWLISSCGDVCLDSFIMTQYVFYTFIKKKKEGKTEKDGNYLTVPASRDSHEEHPHSDLIVHYDQHLEHEDDHHMELLETVTQKV